MNNKYPCIFADVDLLERPSELHLAELACGDF